MIINENLEVRLKGHSGLKNACSSQSIFGIEIRSNILFLPPFGVHGSVSSAQHAALLDLTAIGEQPRPPTDSSVLP